MCGLWSREDERSTMQYRCHRCLLLVSRFRQCRMARRMLTSPEETRLGSPIPGTRVQHKRRVDIVDDTADVVKHTSEHDRLLSEASGAGLSHDGIAHGSDSEVVDERVDEKHGADGPAGSLVDLDSGAINDDGGVGWGEAGTSDAS